MVGRILRTFSMSSSVQMRSLPFPTLRSGGAGILPSAMYVWIVTRCSPSFSAAWRVEYCLIWMSHIADWLKTGKNYFAFLPLRCAARRPTAEGRHFGRNTRQWENQGLEKAISVLLFWTRNFYNTTLTRARL